LECKHSPEQISRSLQSEGFQVPSRTSIYNFIQSDRRCGGTLHLNLRINGKRGYRHRNKASRHKLPGRVGIEYRPVVVASRKRYADWEAGLIAGCHGGGHLLSLYERKSRLGKLFRLNGKDAATTVDAIIAALEGMCAYTIIYDTGLEFAGHQKVSKALGADGYFCQPYRSWEKAVLKTSTGLCVNTFERERTFLLTSRPN
jgi:IS30 family transposase